MSMGWGQDWASSHCKCIKAYYASQCQGWPCSLPNWSVMSTQRTCRSTPKSLGHVNAIFIQTAISPETLLWKTPRNQFVLSIYLRSRDPKSFSSFQVGLNLSQLRFGQLGYNLLLSDIPRQIKIQLGIGRPAVSPLEGPTSSAPWNDSKPERFSESSPSHRSRRQF